MLNPDAPVFVSSASSSPSPAVPERTLSLEQYRAASNRLHSETTTGRSHQARPQRSPQPRAFDLYNANDSATQAWAQQAPLPSSEHRNRTQNNLESQLSARRRLYSLRQDEDRYRRQALYEAQRGAWDYKGERLAAEAHQAAEAARHSQYSSSRSTQPAALQAGEYAAGHGPGLLEDNRVGDQGPIRYQRPAPKSNSGSQWSEDLPKQQYTSWANAADLAHELPKEAEVRPVSRTKQAAGNMAQSPAEEGWGRSCTTLAGATFQSNNASRGPPAMQLSKPPPEPAIDSQPHTGSYFEVIRKCVTIPTERAVRLVPKIQNRVEEWCQEAELNLPGTSANPMTDDGNQLSLPGPPGALELGENPQEGCFTLPRGQAYQQPLAYDPRYSSGRNLAEMQAPGGSEMQPPGLAKPCNLLQPDTEGQRSWNPAPARQYGRPSSPLCHDREAAKNWTARKEPQPPSGAVPSVSCWNSNAEEQFPSYRCSRRHSSPSKRPSRLGPSILTQPIILTSAPEDPFPPIPSHHRRYQSHTPAYSDQDASRTHHSGSWGEAADEQCYDHRADMGWDANPGVPPQGFGSFSPRQRGNPALPQERDAWGPAESAAQHSECQIYEQHRPLQSALRAGPSRIASQPSILSAGPIPQYPDRRPDQQQAYRASQSYLDSQPSHRSLHNNQPQRQDDRGLQNAAMRTSRPPAGTSGSETYKLRAEAIKTFPRPEQSQVAGSQGHYRNSTCCGQEYGRGGSPAHFSESPMQVSNSRYMPASREVALPAAASERHAAMHQGEWGPSSNKTRELALLPPPRGAWEDSPKPVSGWAMLPSALVYEIAKRLSKPADLMTMRSICRGWISEASIALTKVVLCKTPLRPGSFTALACAFKSIATLEIYKCHTLSEFEMRAGLCCLPHLVSLQVLRCDQLSISTGYWLPALQRVRTLRDLTVNMHDKGLKALGALTQLTRLNLHHNTCFDSRQALLISPLTGLKALVIPNLKAMGDRSLEFALKGMVELTHLNLRGCWRLSLRTVDELPRLPNLQEINLSMFRNMSYHGLSTLSQCTSVCVLHLGYSGAVNDNSAPLLAGMTQLRILSLTGCINLGDAGLSILAASLSNLESLNLMRCWRLTDVGIQELQRLPQLKLLNLMECPDISVDIITLLSWNLQIMLADPESCSVARSPPDTGPGTSFAHLMHGKQLPAWD